MVGVLEPRFRVGQVQGRVVKADSAAKSLVGGRGGEGVVEGVKGVEDLKNAGA